MTEFGKLITGNHRGKDAIHVACADVTAAEDLMPGDQIGLDSDNQAARLDKPVGLVDPFLSRRVRKGERFWLFMFPGTVTDIRHQWSHPAFSLEGRIDSARSWLSQFANRLWPRDEGFPCGHEYLIDELSLVLSGKEKLCAGIDGVYEIPQAEWAEMWQHYRTITGYTGDVPLEDFYRCAC